MNPQEFMTKMRDQLSLKQILSPKQIDESQEVLDVTFGYIAKKLVNEGYDDMCPTATKIAEGLSTIVIVFLQQANNPGMLLKEVSLERA